MGRWAEPRGEREDRAVNTEGLRFDVNCPILFTELPLLKRPVTFGWREPDEV